MERKRKGKKGGRERRNERGKKKRRKERGGPSQLKFMTTPLAPTSTPQSFRGSSEEGESLSVG